MAKDRVQPVFDVASITGLSEATVAERLREEGYNELPSSRQRSVLAIALEVVREPMFLLLVVCGLLYMVMGEPTDALMLLGFVFVVMGITIFQERRTERALEALKDLSSPRALVVRDGRQKRIAGREVVRGDIVLVAEGDRVPADATLLHGINLTVDESLLTGESVPVRKSPAANAQPMQAPGGDDLPFLYSGTLVTAGQGVAEVQKTGMRTELGKIGKAIHGIEPERTLLQIETGRLVRYLAVVGLALCAIVVVAYGLESRQLRRVLAGRLLGRNHDGNGDVARGTSRGAHHLPGPGGMAYFAEPGSDSPDAGH